MYDYYAFNYLHEIRDLVAYCTLKEKPKRIFLYVAYCLDEETSHEYKKLKEQKRFRARGGLVAKWDSELDIKR